MRSLIGVNATGSVSVKVLPAPGVLVTRELTAEQVRKIARNRQTQTRTAVFAVRAAVGLAKRFEDDALLAFGDTDAGVAHGERNPVRLI